MIYGALDLFFYFYLYNLTQDFSSLVYGCKILIQPMDDEEPKLIEITDMPIDFKGLILEVVLPKPQYGYFGMFMKKARRKEFDLAILNMAALVKIKDDDIIEDIKLAFGGSSQLLQYHEGPRKVKNCANSIMSYLANKKVCTYNFDNFGPALHSLVIT